MASQKTEVLRENEFLIILEMHQLSYLHCRRIGKATIFKEVEEFGHFTLDDDAQIELEMEWKFDIEMWKLFLIEIGDAHTTGVGRRPSMLFMLFM